MSLTRRDFAGRSALTGAGVALAGSAGALATVPNALASTDTGSVREEHGNGHGPDNITVFPYGGLVIAEDGEGVQHLFGATDSGRTYPIARNELTIGTEDDPECSEFTGVTFSPDGRTLYADIQTPGIMPAITGPWKRRRRGR